MKQSHEKVETRPESVITDKMTAYPTAVKDVFDGATHIKAGIRSPINNNKLESFMIHGENGIR